MSSGIINAASMVFLLPLANILLYCMIVIGCFNCIWRVEKKLDLFLKLLGAGFVVILIRMVIGVAGFATSPNWLFAIRATDFLAGVFYLSSMFVMYKLIRNLNLEKKSK